MTYEEFKKHCAGTCRIWRRRRINNTPFGAANDLLGSHGSAYHECYESPYVWKREYSHPGRYVMCHVEFKREEQIQYWPVRPLYERYRQEGWQSILPEISAGLEESDKKKMCRLQRKV